MKIQSAFAVGVLLAIVSASPGFAANHKTGPCFNYRQAARHVGEAGCISGVVIDAYTSRRGNTFLDFCANYKTCPFSSVIFASDSSKFEGLQALTGQQVQIRGLITTYQGRAEIIIRDPWQIRVRAVRHTP